jgi:hypothetical protein
MGLGGSLLSCPVTSAVPEPQLLLQWMGWGKEGPQSTLSWWLPVTASLSLDRRGDCLDLRCRAIGRKASGPHPCRGARKERHDHRVCGCQLPMPRTGSQRLQAARPRAPGSRQPGPCLHSLQQPESPLGRGRRASLPLSHSLPAKREASRIVAAALAERCPPAWSTSFLASSFNASLRPRSRPHEIRERRP